VAGATARHARARAKTCFCIACEPTRKCRKLRRCLTPVGCRKAPFLAAVSAHRHVLDQIVQPALLLFCQSALKFNPLSASNRDPSLALGQACPGSE
jgi:hypothetical protein